MPVHCWGASSAATSSVPTRPRPLIAMLSFTAGQLLSGVVNTKPPWPSRPAFTPIGASAWLTAAAISSSVRFGSMFTDSCGPPTPPTEKARLCGPLPRSEARSRPRMRKRWTAGLPLKFRLLSTPPPAFLRRAARVETSWRTWAFSWASDDCWRIALRAPGAAAGVAPAAVLSAAV
ncbi:hypothetical protein [Massilia aerilata]|uniref:hypothetical protein n=1 Tax=Massilia aerilata TaxID=453817 RepID=UPI0036D30975